MLCVPIFLPMLLVVALAIRLDGPGPIFFIQTRVGHRGRSFRMIKVRTMFHGASGPSVTEQGDSRITRVGWYLRRTRLDELPQFSPPVMAVSDARIISHLADYTIFIVHWAKTRATS